MTPQRGFTLLELLIGMTLLGFILALLFGGFRLASTTWDAVEAKLERTTQEEMTRALVRRLLSQLQPMRWKKALNQPIAFVGEGARLLAVAPLSGQAGSSGLRVIELTAGSESQGEKTSARLVLRQAPLSYAAEDFSATLANAKEHTILDGMTAVRFEYFGEEKKGDPPRWQETWTNKEQLPRLVRVRLTSPDDGWADLVVMPMVREGGCTLILDLSFNQRCA